MRYGQTPEQAAAERKWLARIAARASALILVLVAIFMVGCPQYRVYNKTQSGKAALEQARHDRQIQIEEAQANLEAERLNAQAEIERAKGAAKAIEIEGGNLSETYIKYLWVRQQGSLNEADKIYIPTEAGLPLLEARK